MGIKRILIVITLLSMSFGAHAQSEVEHTIVQGNTLFELAKEYGSTVEAIYEANPHIGVRSLVIGETLLIPIPEKEIVDSSMYTFHTVRSFESVFGISNKYSLKDSTIYWHNPILKNSPLVRAGQVLRIPKNPDSWRAKSGEFDSMVPQKKAHYSIYVVKPGDSPKSLSKAWGFSVIEEFYALNPDARDDWWVGMNLVRPITVDVAKRTFNIRDNVQDGAVVSAAPGDTLVVAAALPFFLKDYIHQSSKASRSEMAFSFRQGMEYAIAEVSTSEHPISLITFDTYNDKDSLEAVMKDLETAQPDVIIGPMYSSRVMQFKGQPLESIVVSPLSKNTALNTTSVWNSIVDENVFIDAIKDDFSEALAIDKLDSSYAKLKKILVVGLNSGASKAKSNRLINGLAKEDYVLIEGDESWSKNEELGLLDSTVSYHLVITNNDPAFVLDVLRNLRSGDAKYHWLALEYQAFDNGLVSTVFQREEVTVYTSTHIDYDLAATASFVAGFRAMFSREPDRWAIEGYDNALYHLLRLTQGKERHRGIKKGYKYEGADHQNTYVERRSYQGLRWILQP